ncbi:MAG: methyltransferase [Sneathiella sp.]|uniref:class I SAM-dependent methyltransferase n=1 Tax=Sneathiella sp. TaxID=1964365 RepID=UPI0030010821
MDNYSLNDGVYVPSNRSHSFGYSEGDKTEDALFEIVQSTSDTSAGSDDLFGHVHDWATKYHFSRSRFCLLKPLEPLMRDADVLEIGAGCGAITPYLCEVANTVTAIEGSERRARITASRCKSFSNITVICDNFDLVNTGEKYDFITLIGVLEYSQAFVKGEDPAFEMLKKCNAMLKPNGKLVIAIENKLGLKYFAGAPEDHLGKAHSGIYDLYDDKPVRTFGKQEITRKLKKVFNNADFYYPFPDYKLPKLVVSEQAFDLIEPEKRDCLKGVLQRGQADIQAQSYPRHFSEAMSFDAIIDNDILGDVSNSFLIVAGDKTVFDPSGGPFAWTFSTERRKCFNKLNVFEFTDGIVNIQSSYLHDMPRKEDTTYSHHIVDEAYISGISLLKQLYKLLAEGKQSETDILDWARPWCELVLELGSSSSGKRVIDGQYCDLIPENTIIGSDGSLQKFDQEWRYASEIPIDWLILRGLRMSLDNVPAPLRTLDKKHKEAVFRRIVEEFGGVYDANLIQQVNIFEKNLQLFATGSDTAKKPKKRNRFTKSRRVRKLLGIK